MFGHLLLPCHGVILVTEFVYGVVLKIKQPVMVASKDFLFPCSDLFEDAL